MQKQLNFHIISLQWDIGDFRNCLKLDFKIRKSKKCGAKWSSGINEPDNETCIPQNGCRVDHSINLHLLMYEFLDCNQIR